jgi:hypothetical protein
MVVRFVQEAVETGSGANAGSGKPSWINTATKFLRFRM